MSIDLKTVEKIAELARLEFNEEEKLEISKDLDRMLNFVDKLKEIDTDGVEPLIYMTDGEDVLREDEVNNSLTQEQALKNAPSKDTDYFKVPKVIDKSER